MHNTNVDKTKGNGGRRAIPASYHAVRALAGGSAEGRFLNMKPPPKPPAVGRGALAAGFAQTLGRVSGLLRDIIFTAVFGASATADAFFVAFRVPNMFRELLAEGTLSNVFVPLFAESQEKRGLEDAWRLANALLGILLLILGLLTLGIYVFSDPLVLVVAKGFEANPQKFALTSWLTRLLAPFLAGISVAALFGGMLNVRGKFFLPSIAPAALNICIIVACLMQETWVEWTGTPAIGAVAVAATLSGLLTACVQFPALYRDGFRFRPSFGKHPGLRSVLKFVGAALVGVVVVQFNVLVEMQLASQNGDGPVSWLMLGFRLVQIPMSVVAGSIAVAALARFSIQRAQQANEEARQTLGESIEMTIFLVVPAAVGLYLLAEPLVALCFERGAFTSSDTAETANILRGYAFAVIGICIYRVILPIFFALKDPWTPMKMSLVVMAIKIPVAMALLNALGLIGLPLSHAVTVTLEVVVLMTILGRRTGGWRTGLWFELLRICIAASFMGVTVFALEGLLPPMGHLRVLLLCLLGAAVYAVFAFVLQVRSLSPILQRLTRRIQRKRLP